MSTAKKLAAIAGRIAMPAQSARNKYEGYDYSTRDDVFAVVRSELSREGLIWIPSATITAFEPAPPTSKGVPQFRTHVLVDVTITDGEDSVQFTWPGEQVTNTDRGASMATTQAVRTGLINLFMLMGTDPEEATKGQTQAPGPVRDTTPAPAETPRVDPRAQAWSNLDKLIRDAGCTPETTRVFIDEVIPAAESKAGNTLPREEYPIARIEFWMSALQKKTPADIKIGVEKQVMATTN